MASSALEGHTRCNPTRTRKSSKNGDIRSYSYLFTRAHTVKTGLYRGKIPSIEGETGPFLARLLHTLGISASLAIGVLLVSSLVRMILQFKLRLRKEA